MRQNLKMKIFLLLLLSCLPVLSFAQQDCKLSVITTDDGREVKTTQEYLMYENVFGTAASYIFFTLSINDGVPLLNLQLLTKSKELTKIYCMDKSSRIYLQLSNGKIATLMSVYDEQCSGLVYDENDKNNIRILTNSFYFTQGTLEDLEKYPVTFMRIRYISDTIDYTIRKELQSETTPGKYFPETYFMTNLKCIK